MTNNLKRCEVCGRTGSDRAHIKTRGAGAKWEDFEWLYLCRKHHQQQGQVGWFVFIVKYPVIELVLLSKGWKIEKVFGVNKLTRSEG